MNHFGYFYIGVAKFRAPLFSFFSVRRFVILYICYIRIQVENFADQTITRETEIC